MLLTSEKVPGRRTQALRSAHFWRVEPVLVASNERTLQNPTRTLCAVLGAAVPEMSVEHQHRPGTSDDKSLIRVFAGRIGEALRRRIQQLMCAWNNPGRAVLPGEVVKQPDR